MRHHHRTLQSGGAGYGIHAHMDSGGIGMRRNPSELCPYGRYVSIHSRRLGRKRVRLCGPASYDGAKALWKGEDADKKEKQPRACCSVFRCGWNLGVPNEGVWPGDGCAPSGGGGGECLCVIGRYCGSVNWAVDVRCCRRVRSNSIQWIRHDGWGVCAPGRDGCVR